VPLFAIYLDRTHDAMGMINVFTAKPGFQLIAGWKIISHSEKTMAAVKETEADQ